MSVKDTIANATDNMTATINASGTTSDAQNMAGLRLFGIITPAALTGTSFTFLASIDGVTYNPLYDSTGIQVSVTASTSRFTALDPTLFASIQYLKLVSGSTEAATRSITLVLRGV